MFEGDRDVVTVVKMWLITQGTGLMSAGNRKGCFCDVINTLVMAGSMWKTSGMKV